MNESDEKMVHAVCPRCSARLKVSSKHAGGRLPCPKCRCPIEVRLPKPSPTLDSSKTYIAPPDDEDEYAIRDMPPEASQHSGPIMTAGTLAEAQAGGAGPGLADDGKVLPPSERPKLPRHPMVSGVLTFFYSTGAVICWSGFSLTAMVSFCAAGAAMGALSAGMFGVAAGFIMGLVSIAIATVGLIVFTGFLMAILQDSAAGNKQIVEWPDLVIIDWIGGAIYFVVSVLGPFCLMYVVALPLGGLLAHWWLVPLGVWILFPIVLLSTLEMQSPLMPVSPIVVQSLGGCALTWLVFYIQTGVMGLGLAVFGALVFGFAPGTVGFSMLAGAVVAGMMLYFRLLGRLAWVCDEHFRRKRIEEKDDEGQPAKAAEDDSAPGIRETPVDDF